jgi:hypothetical protein
MASCPRAAKASLTIPLNSHATNTLILLSSHDVSEQPAYAGYGDYVPVNGHGVNLPATYPTIKAPRISAIAQGIVIIFYPFFWSAHGCPVGSYLSASSHENLFY